LRSGGGWVAEQEQCAWVIVERPAIPPSPRQVNARLAKVEQEHGGSSSGDPAYPKAQWPYTRACPDCRRATSGGGGGAAARVVGVEWDEGKVLEHLNEAYGGVAPDAGSVAGIFGDGGGGGAAASATKEPGSSGKASSGGDGKMRVKKSRSRTGADGGGGFSPMFVTLVGLAALTAALRRRRLHRHGSGKLA
jgi:hypothetical protein